MELQSSLGTPQQFCQSGAIAILATARQNTAMTGHRCHRHILSIKASPP